VKPLTEFKGDDALSQMAKALPAPVILSNQIEKKGKK
jgi:hypothetical protein